MDIQTPAEKFLIKEVADLVNRDSSPKLLLNIGAGKSLVLEESVQKLASSAFVCDRLDVVSSAVRSSLIRKIFVDSAENMKGVGAGEYDVAFANYVLEHVGDIRASAAEIARVLKPGGFFILSSPNPKAPEFILSRHTPTKFHQLIKGEGETAEAHPTHYAYRSIDELVDIFKKNGFEVVRVKFFAFTLGYLYRFPLINWLSRGYDAVVKLIGIKRLMGNVGLVFKKTRNQ